MKGIYDYILETNLLSKVYSVAAILCLKFLAHVILFPMLNVVWFCIGTFRLYCCCCCCCCCCCRRRRRHHHHHQQHQ